MLWCLLYIVFSMGYRGLGSAALGVHARWRGMTHCISCEEIMLLPPLWPISGYYISGYVIALFWGFLLIHYLITLWSQVGPLLRVRKWGLSWVSYYKKRQDLIQNTKEVGQRILYSSQGLSHSQTRGQPAWYGFLRRLSDASWHPADKDWMKPKATIWRQPSHTLKTRYLVANYSLCLFSFYYLWTLCKELFKYLSLPSAPQGSF